MDGRMDGWMNRWMDACMHACIVHMHACILENIGYAGDSCSACRALLCYAMPCYDAWLWCDCGILLLCCCAFVY